MLALLPFKDLLLKPFIIAASASLPFIYFIKNLMTHFLSE